MRRPPCATGRWTACRARVWPKSGVDAGAVGDVIVTHLHYDHAGTLSDFPNARFHLQDSEMEYATGRCMCHEVLKAPYHIEDICTMVRKVYAGEVTFHDGDATLAPGVSVHHIGGHAKGADVRAG